MQKLGLASFALLSLLTALAITESNQVDADVDMIGRKLAQWSNQHQRTIKINGRPINLAGGTTWAYAMRQTPDGLKPVCRGSATVRWQTPLASAEDNRVLRENLKAIIQSSDCGGRILMAYVRGLDNYEGLKRVTVEELAEDLQCLGRFEFVSVETE